MNDRDAHLEALVLHLLRASGHSDRLIEAFLEQGECPYDAAEAIRQAVRKRLEAAGDDYDIAPLVCVATSLANASANRRSDLFEKPAARITVPKTESQDW